jgi:hypothetical protein
MIFEEYKKDWLKRHPGRFIPKPRISSWGLVGGLFLWAVIATGSSLVSGAHSIPAILTTIPAIVTSPYREILSLFGFTIFELLIFAGALYRRLSDYAKYGLYAALVGAFAANVGSSVYSVLNANNSTVLDLVVAIVLAIIAPLAAFLAGEMVHKLFENHNEKMAILLVNWQKSQNELDAIINREFKKYQKEQTGQTNRTDRFAPRLSAQTNTDKQPKQAALDYLHNNPGNYTVRGLAEAAGVTNDAAHKALKMYSGNGHSQNGSS